MDVNDKRAGLGFKHYIIRCGDRPSMHIDIPEGATKTKRLPRIRSAPPFEFSQASSFAFAFSFRFILPLDRTFRQTNNKLQRKEDNKLQREEVCCGGKAFYLMERIFFKISWYLRRRRCPARRTWRIYCQVLAVAPGYLSCCRPSRLIACPMVNFSAFYLNGFVHFADIFLY